MADALGRTRSTGEDREYHDVIRKGGDHRAGLPRWQGPYIAAELAKARHHALFTYSRNSRAKLGTGPPSIWLAIGAIRRARRFGSSQPLLGEPSAFGVVAGEPNPATAALFGGIPTALPPREFVEDQLVTAKDE